VTRAELSTSRREFVLLAGRWSVVLDVQAWLLRRGEPSDASAAVSASCRPAPYTTSIHFVLRLPRSASTTVGVRLDGLA
jgi:hypothetical protein